MMGCIVVAALATPPGGLKRLHGHNTDHNAGTLLPLGGVITQTLTKWPYSQCGGGGLKHFETLDVKH